MDKQAPSKRAKQKRNRIITACFDCRERKAGCDRRKPVCSRCQDGRTCIYLDPPGNALVNGTSRKVSSLPSEIKDKVTRLYSQCLGDAKDDDDASDYEGLEASPLVTESASYDDDADETEVTDLGFQIGKIHLTDRIGGQYRPGMAHELKMLLQAASHQREWAEEQATWPTPPEVFQTGLETPTASFLKPSPAYLAPNLDPLAVDATQELMDFLPPFVMSARILQQYWRSVHPVARILHRPSFDMRWQVFARNLQTKTRPVKSLQALVFSILFSGIVAMPKGTIDSEFGDSQQSWMQKLKTGTEIALTQAQVLQTAKVETLQAFVAYLIVLCRDEVSRVHSSLVAAAIRVAECNGLHCDGEQRGYNPIETHVRRLIWYNLCFLDIRVTEAHGPRPIIRVEDCTTKLPSNVNDADLTKRGCKETPETKWTEMTVPLIRFRCNEFIRTIWVNRRKVMAREMSITPVIDSIESFRLEWSLKLTPSNPNDPLQRYGLCMLDLQTLRTYAMVLHPYHLHPKLQMPDRLYSILIENGIKTMDRAIEIGTFEEYAPWRWYAGALHQHHYALLMATEIITNPRRKESPRIWRGLDYVFEPPPLPPIAKARWVLTQAWWKMEVYTGKRALRAPTDLEQNLKAALKIADVEVHRDTRLSSASTETTLGDDDGNEAASTTSKRKPSQVKSTKKRVPSKSSTGVPALSPKSEERSPPKTQISIATTAAPTSLPATSAPTKQMVDVDWGVLNNYYPPEQYTGDLDVPFETWSHLLQSTPCPTEHEQGSVSVGSSSQYAFNYNNSLPNPSASAQMAGQGWGNLWQPLPQATQPSQFPPQQQVSPTSWDGSGTSPTVHQPNALQWGADLTPQQQLFQQPYNPQQQSSQPQPSPQWTGNNPLGAGYNMPLNTSVLGQQNQDEQRRQNSELNFGMGLYQPIPRTK